DARDVDLVLGLLGRRPDEVAERVELAAEIGLVEIPAAQERPLHGRHGSSPEPHRASASPSAISAGPRPRAALGATLTAFAIARAAERPWHLMKSCSNPRIGAPP